MPYTRKQIDRINNINGEPFLDGSFSLSMRTSESYIRRRLFALEDATVNTLFDMWKTAYQSIRRAALDRAATLGVSQLAVTPETLNWKRDVMEYAALRIRRLSQETADTVLSRAVAAYALGYYGKAYVLDVSTTKGTEIKIPRLENRGVTRRVIQPHMKEAIEPDQFIYDLLGDNWQDTYTDIGDELVIKIRRAIDGGMANADTLSTVLTGVAAVMGTDSNQGGAFSRANGATRDYMLGAASNGGMDLMAANPVWVLGTMWVATADERTCPTCQSLNGKTWQLGDPDMRIAPFDSHSRCRCGSLPVMLPGSEKPEDEPPDYTWDEWLDGINELWWLKQELGQATLDSKVIG